jgi:hypothetical protein
MPFATVDANPASEARQLKGTVTIGIR